MIFLSREWDKIDICNILIIISVAVVLTITHAWFGFLLFWIIPLFTWFMFLMKLRSIAEHFGIADINQLGPTRNVTPNLFDRVFICSYGIQYHLDHHHYPTVPCYNLPTLNKELLKSNEYIKNAHVSKGYIGVLRECTIDVELETGRV